MGIARSEVNLLVDSLLIFVSFLFPFVYSIHPDIRARGRRNLERSSLSFVLCLLFP